MLTIANVKQQARQLVEELPENATWDDLMYEIYVRQAVEAGIRDSDAGRTHDVKQVRARLGLTE
ncbi:MAG: hypothetical protein U1F76_03100 [Candidatus Competibacteraceae bacterium]